MDYKPVVFTDDLLTGNATIDMQHKGLFDQMDKILDSVIAGKSQEEVYKLVQFLEDYTASHFKAEEALMKSHEYKNISFHQAQHERFTRELSKYKKQLAANKPELKQISVILNNLQDWLVDHVMQEDKEFARTIRGEI